MTVWHIARARRWILVAMVLACLPMSRLAWAGDLAKLDNSLALVPEDAAFYSSSMRLGEQLEIVANSQAWARLKAMPSVQDALKLLEQQADHPDAATFQQVTKNPAVIDALELLKDMFAQEAFVFGDERYPEFLRIIQEVGNSARYGPLFVELTGGMEGMGEDEFRAGLILSVLAENVDTLDIPTMIAGFKITDKDRAQRNLTNLTGMATIATMAVPQLAQSVQQTKIGEDNFLVIQLDGEMLPWDEIPVDEIEEIELEPGDADKVIAKLRKMTLSIAIGVRGDYLLLSIGSSTECLENLGEGKLLVERPEFDKLEPFADERLASITYISLAMSQLLVTSKQDFDDLLEGVEELLPELELSKAEQAAILRDAKDIIKDIKPLIPEPGPIVGCSFLTSEGVESYQYNWSETLTLDGSKPLTLLKHADGDPLLAVAWRCRDMQAYYDLGAKICTIGHHYFEEYGLPKMSPRERGEYQRFKKPVLPMVKRLDQVNREMLLPALADGQFALLLDAKLKIRKLVKDMPDPGKPMPFIEPAIVVGVSDAKKLRAACIEYQTVFEEFWDVLRELEPGDIPEFEFPEPKIKQVDEGAVYTYPLPKEYGVDKKIVPSMGLSKSTAAITLSSGHANRLLTAQPLAIDGALADPDQPRAVAALFDFAATVEAIRPWADYITREILKENYDLSDDAPKENKDQAEQIVEQVHTVLDVLKVFRVATLETHIEDGIVVTHTTAEIRDIE